LATRVGGVAGAAWGQLLLFSLLSVVSLLVFRKPLMRRFGLAAPGPPVDSMIGEICTVVQAPGADGFGKVELRGTSWTARAAPGASFTVGQRCRVERVDGLTLWIRPESDGL
jgi:membrane protein implicated in regulation of membrane protease activity